MEQNELYDVIIIGASDEGIEAGLNLEASGKKVLLISRSVNTKRKKLPSNILESSCSLFSYLHGLLCVSLQDGRMFCGKKLIIATGSKAKKLPFKSNTLYYKPSDFSSSQKTYPIMLINANDCKNDKKLAVFALKLANKYKYIFICSKNELKISKKYKDLLKNCKNISILPFCEAIGCKNDKNGDLLEIKFDTYSTIKSKYAIAFTNRTPEVPKFIEKFVDINEDGQIIVNKAFETTKVKEIYAIGDCSSSNVANQGKKVVKYISE